MAGGWSTSGIEWRISELRDHAQLARRSLAEIEALPFAQAERLIRDRAAQAEAERTAEAARLARAAEYAGWDPPTRDSPSCPQRDLGLSLW